MESTSILEQAGRLFICCGRSRPKTVRIHNPVRITTHFLLFREADSSGEEAGELEERLQLATQILVISVLTILLTAPVGAVAVMTAGPRLLEAQQSQQDDQLEQADTT